MAMALVGARRALALGIVWLAAASAVAAPRYAFEAVTPPPGRVVDGVVGFTASGHIAGVWRAPGGAAVAGFLGPDGGFTQAGSALPDGAQLWAADETHGFVGRLGDAAWRFGPTPGPVPGVPSDLPGWAAAINASGVIVGEVDDPDIAYQSRAFVAVPGRPVRHFDGMFGAYAHDVNDRGIAVIVAPGEGYYRYDTAADRLTSFAAAEDFGIYSADINERGDIVTDVGWRYEERVIAFLADGTHFRVPGLPDLPFQHATSLNDRGQILGQSFAQGPLVDWETRPFVYTPGEGSVDVLAAADIPAGWTSVGLHDLNNRGDILGSGVFGGRAQLFVLRAVASPVPEPATWALGLLGALGVMHRVRRRGPAGRPALPIE